MTNDQEARAAGRVFGRADAKHSAKHDDYYVEHVEREHEDYYSQFRESRWERALHDLHLAEASKPTFERGWQEGAIGYARNRNLGLKRTDPKKCRHCERPFGDGAGMVRVEIYPGMGLDGGLTMVPCNKCKKG